MRRQARRARRAPLACGAQSRTAGRPCRRRPRPLAAARLGPWVVTCPTRRDRSKAPGQGAGGAEPCSHRPRAAAEADLLRQQGREGRSAPAARAAERGRALSARGPRTALVAAAGPRSHAGRSRSQHRGNQGRELGSPRLPARRQGRMSRGSLVLLGPFASAAPLSPSPGSVHAYISLHGPDPAVLPCCAPAQLQQLRAGLGPCSSCSNVFYL